MAADIAIGTRIRKQRQILRLTQKQLADQLGVSTSAVANWERGKHFPRRYLGRIEAVLGILLDQGEPALPRVLSAQMHREIAELLDDEEDRAYVTGLLEGTIARPRS